MTEGMIISIDTKHGEVIIKAGKGAKRSYTWEGQTLHTVLVPREKIWHGTLGLLDNNNLRPPHKNVIHMLIEECQIHFKSIADANKSLTRTAKFDTSIEDIYTDDGLFVRFRKGPLEDKYAIEFNVYQVLIKGNKPDKLSGSQNSETRVSIDT